MNTTIDSNHWPSRCSRAAGLAVLLMNLLGAVPGWSADVSLVSTGAVWKYDDTGTDLGTAWRAPGFDDSSWASGPSQLGYGDGDESTVINSSPIRPCYYFRQTFTVANPAVFTSLSLEILRDDGCVVYLNGTEVARYNMPAGTITYSTWASSAADYPWDPPQAIANLLVAGNNVIAVEVHQGNSTSSDVSLDLKLTGTSEIAIVLDSPAAGATEISSSAVLTATATDPEGQPLNISFWGRPAPPPVPDFTLVVLPDTQYYTDEINGGTKEMFISQTQWIVNNRDAHNIVYVAHLGDVSNNGDIYLDEWRNATNALYRLENPILPLFPDGIPYGAAVGNHDQMVPSGDNEPTTYYNQYFGASRFQGRSYYGGHLGINNNNQYHLFSASGFDFIVIYLEYDATPDQAVLDWADALLKANPGRRGIVVTHYLLETTAAWGVQGQAIYNALRDNANLSLMLCGHNHGEARRTDVYAGNTVHTLLSDYQSYANGGNGYLRLLRFSPVNNQIYVQTYSPWLNLSETDASSQFTLSHPMQSGASFELVQENTSVSSGTPTSAIWPGLPPGTEFEWYATATDGTETRASEARRFTTSANTPPTVAITSPLSGSVVSLGEGQGTAPVAISASASDSDGQVVRVEFFAGTSSLGEDTEAPFELTSDFPMGSYVLSAVATDNGGMQTVSQPITITIGGAPAAPANLIAQAQSTTQILLGWSDVSANETGFEIHQSLDGQSYTLIGTVGPDVSSTLVTQLQPATSYYYYVSAFNGAGHGDSGVASATTLAPLPVPAAPSGLMATPLSAAEISLVWSDNSVNESGFQIERSADGSSWALLAAVAANQTAFVDAGLTAGTAYYYRVRACNGSGCSAPTDMAAAAPFLYAYATGETTVAGTLTGTRADTYADDGVYEQLTEKLAGGKPATRYSVLDHKWVFTVTPGQSVTFFLQAYQPASADGDRFVFSYSTDDISYQDMTPFALPVSDDGSYQVYALPGTLQGTVYVRVQDSDHTIGRNALDTLYVDQILIRTDVSPMTAPPAAPVLQQAIAGNEAVTLTWAASAGATSYTVWRKSGSSDYTAVAADYTGTTYTDTALNNGTTYEYVVTAHNTFGSSAWSSPLSATPQAPLATEPPTNLTAAGAKRKITLNWTQSSTVGVVQNKIYRSTTSDGSYVLLATIAAGTSYSDAVATGSAYYYTVTAVSSSGESATSNSAGATAR